MTRSQGVLDGKTALVTGAGQGIGRGVALALVKEGADVVITDRAADRLDATANELRALGAKTVPVLGDVSDPDHVSATVAAATAEFGRLDILVNNAQGLRPGVPFEEHTDADFDLAISTGLWGTFRFMRGCFPLMADHDAAVVNIVSSAGTHGLPGFAGYGAAKEGIRGLTKVAANEWGPRGIRVNALCPQANSPTTEAYFATHPERRAQKIAERPIRRDGDAEADIGRTVVFLVGPDSGFITGATLMANGGLTLLP